MIEHLISIDGEKFEVMLVKVSRKADILDKYARRTVSGDLQREIIGTYYNYSLEFAYNDNPRKYRLLWNKLTEPKEFHDMAIVDTIDIITFKGYISNVSDEVIYANPLDGDERIFKSLKCDLIAKTPSRVPRRG